MSSWDVLMPPLAQWQNGTPTPTPPVPAPAPTAPAAPATTPAGDKARADLYAHYVDDEEQRLRSLVDSTHDPRRKLELWQKYRERANSNELDRLGARKGKWMPSSADLKGQQQNARRLEAVATERQEVADDVKDLLGRKNLSEQDVDKLMARKQLEHELEMKYAVNITTEGGRRPGGSRIVWRQGELEELQSSLSHVPIDQVRGSPGLREIRREDTDPSSNGFDAMQGEGRLNVYDGGADSAETMTHEIGHAVLRDHLGVYDQYRKAAGWQDMSRRDLQKAGLSRDEIRRIRESGGAETVSRNGKTYQADSYGGEFLAVDEGALPDNDDWKYGRTHPTEEFAEHYSKAVFHPDEVYADFVDRPANVALKHQLDFQAAQQRLDALAAGRAPKAELEAARRQVSGEAQALARAQRAQRERKQQFEIMRNQIFGTDRESSAALTRLRGQGIGKDQLAAFEKEAGKMSTPQQIQELERKARGSR